MHDLTTPQRAILDFVVSFTRAHRTAPTVREIGRKFGLRSTRTVSDHLDALKRKGALSAHPRRARSLRVVTPLDRFARDEARIPVYGSIPAGFPDERHQQAKGCVTIDVATLGMRPTARTFALEVRGDSMVGRHILDGDIVVFEPGVNPKEGDVVAALIDGESTLKTFVMNRGRPFLRAENPGYPNLVPAESLVIQGVMVALIRRSKRRRV